MKRTPLAGYFEVKREARGYLFIYLVSYKHHRDKLELSKNLTYVTNFSLWRLFQVAHHMQANDANVS